MSHPFSLIDPKTVNDLESAEQYIKQRAGVGYVTANDGVVFKRKVKELFEHYPNASWQTLVRTVEWARARNRRYARLFQVVEAVRYAYEDGYLPELDPNWTGDVDEQITEALQIEEDPAWRKRLLLAQGMQAKADVIQQWSETRAPQFA